jgi:hypothetical protein
MSAIEFEYATSTFAPPVMSSSASREPESRAGERLISNLKTIVQVKEAPDQGWKEVTKVTTVSRNGVGFSLSRPCTVGRLINLILPMPLEYRAHDKNEDLYSVVGIVQHCNEATVNSQRVFHIGVGLVGRELPDSFKKDPKQNYRLTGMQPNGLWAITEAKSQFKSRKNPRFWISLPMTLGLIHRDDEIRKEDTFTKNVSLTGASATTSLNVRVGEKLRFVCPALNFYAIAVVRNISRESEHTATVHVEFDGSHFPIELIMPASGAVRR